MLHEMAPAKHAARSHHIYCAMLVSEVLGDKDNCAAINIEFTKSSTYSTQIYYDCDWYINVPVGEIIILAFKNKSSGDSLYLRMH